MLNVHALSMKFQQFIKIKMLKKWYVYSNTASKLSDDVFILLIKCWNANKNKEKYY